MFIIFLHSLKFYSLIIDYALKQAPIIMVFRNLLLFCAFTGLIALVVGCSSSQNTVNETEYIKKTTPENTWTLKDHLRRATGVRVTGTESFTRVIIRGESTLANPTNQPLFIIDGQKAGHNFAHANDMLHRGEIKYIEVLPSSKSSQYGMEGHYGVILIYTQ